MRALLFTTGSPFSRAVRVILDELGLHWERREEISAPAAEDNSGTGPTLQVPVLWDGDRTLWESGVIAEYLLSQYDERVENEPQLAAHFARPDHEWDDRLTFATIQTLGTALTTISQMKWTGLSHSDNEYLTRCADRLPLVLGWLDTRLKADDFGLLGSRLSAQDIFLCCHVDFAANRPLGLDIRIERYPLLQRLVQRVGERSSLRSNPIPWWEPGVVGYAEDGVTPIFAEDR